MTYIDIGTEAHRRTNFKWSLMPRHAVKDRFNIDAAGGQAPVTSYPKIPDSWTPHPQPSGDSRQLPTRKLAGIRACLHGSETADRGPSSTVNHPPPTKHRGSPSAGPFVSLGVVVRMRTRVRARHRPARWTDYWPPLTQARWRPRSTLRGMAGSPKATRIPSEAASNDKGLTRQRKPCRLDVAAC